MGNMDQYEDGLVTVLQHRPKDAEVLIVLTEPYADPYDLAGEVRFVDAPASASIVEATNLGIESSEAPIIHLLAGGAEVSDGWTEAAVVHFNDPRVAAVTSLVYDASKTGRVIAAGIDYRAGGRRIHLLGGRSIDRIPTEPTDVRGGPRTAVFYRRAALETLGHAFDAALGDDLADIDLALQLTALGMRCVLEPRSVVHARALKSNGVGFRGGLHAERLFLRNASIAGWGKSLAAHPGHVAMDLLRQLPSPSALLGLIGRLVAWCELGRARRHQHRLAQLRALLAIEPPTSRQDVRLHAPHARSTRPNAAPAAHHAER